MLALCLFFLSACAAKKPKPTVHTRTSGVIEDINQFPQNLQVYAKLANPDKRLLPRENQDSLDAKFNNIYFGAWGMRKTTIPRREVASFFKKARGYVNGNETWSQYQWDEMAANANLGKYPSRAQAAITLRNTDLRELPTHKPRFSEPTPDIRKNPFDYFQYSLLPIGTPLLVAHATLDGKWYYVECPIAGGWVDANDVAFVDEAFRRLWTGGSFAALVKDNVPLPGTGPAGQTGRGDIGAILPLAGKRGNTLNVLVPKAGKDGYAQIAELAIAGGAALEKPLPLTPGNVAAVGNEMMNQPYGWGGTLGQRDCSALTRDLFAPFGIWLPRNSVAQARRGTVIPLTGLSLREKESILAQNGLPFFSLVGMRGHIMLYVGLWKGRPAIFHNVWGVRTVEDGDDDARLVIGKAVVTSLTPGMELKNLYRPVTFVDRLRTLTILGGR